MQGIGGGDVGAGVGVVVVAAAVFVGVVVGNKPIFCLRFLNISSCLKRNGPIRGVLFLTAFHI